jgi:hypothetical protein
VGNSQGKCFPTLGEIYFISKKILFSIKNDTGTKGFPENRPELV